MVKNAIIAVLSICLVGMAGYILGQKTSVRQTPQPLPAPKQLPLRSTEQSMLIDDARRWPSGVPVREVSVKKTFLGDHTISHKMFDAPILGWTGRNNAQI